MSYKKLIASAAVAFVAVAMSVTTQAKAEEQSGVLPDGATYEYTSQVKNGRLIVTGSWDHGASPFYLVVDNGWVRGRVDSHPVSFRLSEVRPGAAKMTVR